MQHLGDITRISGYDAPAVDGRWIPVDGAGWQHKCSRCHTVRKTDVARDHYCPNWGAKMDVPNLDTKGGAS